MKKIALILIFILSTYAHAELNINPNKIMSKDTGETVLMRICKDKKVERVIELLQKGADPDAQDKKGNTALIIAVKNNRLENVKALLEAGARWDIVNYDKKTAYDIAKEIGNKEIIKLLEDYGAW